MDMKEFERKIDEMIENAEMKMKQAFDDGHWLCFSFWIGYVSALEDLKYGRKKV